MLILYRYYLQHSQYTDQADPIRIIKASSPDSRTHGGEQLVPQGRQCLLALAYFHTVCWSSLAPLGQLGTHASPSWK